MDFLSLELKNFGPFEDAFINLDGRGLVNIEGVNKDDPSASSNGSGKSSLPDGFYWVLSGETARDVSGDDVIANFAGKDCIGTVVLREDDTVYMIERWRKKKHKGKTNGLAVQRSNPDGTVTDLTQGTDKLTQELVWTILGCSQEVFVKAVYAGQEALPDLPRMTDKQIKTLVEEAAGTEVLVAAYELAKKHLLAKNADLSAASRDLFEDERRLSDSDAKLAEYGSRIDGWGLEQAKKSDTILLDVRLLSDKVRALEADRKKIDVPELQRQQTALKASIAVVDVERTKERELASLVSSASSSVSSAQASFDAKINELRRAKTHLAAVDDKVGTPCGECGKAYGPDDLETAKTIALERVKTLTAEALTLREKIDPAQKAVEEAKSKLAVFQAGMTDVTTAVSDLGVVQQGIVAAGQIDAQIERRSEEVARLKGEVARIGDETNPFIDMRDKEGVRRSALADAVVKARARVVACEKEVEVATAASKTFGPSGVRAFVLDTVTPYLNERTAHYLGTLSDGRIDAVWTTLAKNAKGELVEKFAIEVEKIGGGKSFKALSGGEKRKVRLACALALQDLVGSRATKAINLMILDEVDDALDEAGLERLMAILEEKGREKGTLLVISHRSMKDWIRETVTVTMEGERSTVVGALC